jgi:hypothetical protein
MGDNLVPESMRNSVRAALEDMHETFAKEIKIYKTKTETFVAVTSTYNALYARLKNEQKSIGKVSEFTAKARVDYIDKHELTSMSGVSAQVNLALPEGSIRLKIDKEGYGHIKTSSRIEVDGQLYELVSDSAKSGPFDVHYYIMYLKRKD